MVLQLVYNAVVFVLPSQHWPRAAVLAVFLVILYAYAQGRSTSRERDLHGRFIIFTGPFTPLGLVTLTALAKRGAHIIALSPYQLSHPVPSLILPLLRSTTNNENIFAEYCDLTSATSIRKFCTTFLTSNDTRVDALIFAHEYTTIGRKWFFGGQARQDKEQQEERLRESASLASFLLITLLLPALLVAPVERDIRIVSVVNPFYAAALPTFSTFLESTPSSPAQPQALLLSEGHRALRTIILARHLQRILDSLPNRAADAEPTKAAPTAPHPSNILAVSACPGISRRDTVAPLLGGGTRGWSLAYLILFLPLFVLTKSSEGALQTVLHVLFLPTPLKRAQAKVDAAADEEARKAERPQPPPQRPRVPRSGGNVEVLKPGALYRECAVVRFDVPHPPPPAQEKRAKKSGKGKNRDGEAERPETMLEDDGEFGGEAVGRAVWEWYEARLKVWEAEDRDRVKAAEEAEEREGSAVEDAIRQEESETLEPDNTSLEQSTSS